MNLHVGDYVQVCRMGRSGEGKIWITSKVLLVECIEGYFGVEACLGIFDKAGNTRRVLSMEQKDRIWRPLGENYGSR